MNDLEFLASIDEPSVVVTKKRYDELIKAEEDLKTLHSVKGIKEDKK